MVKALVTALVCGSFLASYASAQEVFSGNQKARPKYPKAELAKGETKTDKSVASVAPKAQLAATRVVASASKPESGGAKKVATAVSTAKSSKPEKGQPSVDVTPLAKSSAPTIVKATPVVIPGQRAPAATPSPIVKPEPPLIAKAQTPVKQTKSGSKSSAVSPKLPAAAIPPPSKLAQATTKPTAKPVTVDVHSQSQTSAKAPVKEVAATESHPAVAKTAASINAHGKVAASNDVSVKGSKPESGHLVVAPPAEGPKHDIVMQVRKTSPGTQTKSVKQTVVTRTEDTEEEEETAAAHISQKPATAAASSAVKKPALATREVIDAHSIAAVPMSLQGHRENGSSVTKVSLVQNSLAETEVPSPASDHFETAFTKLADGFDFPVGRPDAQGYYKARGFRSHGHLGEDWDGVGGGDTDLGDSIYSIGDGLVVFARDCHLGWGNVVIVRHSYREGGAIRTIDSLYAHLNSILVRKGQAVSRGQKIATMGTAHGLYDAHLHLEIRKNIEIGMSRAAFAQDFSNYYDPSGFIQAHRRLQSGGGNYRVAMNTFTRDSRIHWDRVRNYSHAHTGGGTGESSAALKRAVAAKNE